MPLVSYGPTMGDGSATSMGNILGDAWRYVKKEPLVLVPPIWWGKKSIQYIPKLLKGAKGEAQATIAPFRPATPPSQLDAITQALTGQGSSGASSGSSMLPIILGAGALGLVLILALGKKKKT